MFHTITNHVRFFLFLIRNFRSLLVNRQCRILGLVMIMKVIFDWYFTLFGINT